MKSRVHPKYKTQYRIGNWPEYDRSLVHRGNLTLWLSQDAIASQKEKLVIVICNHRGDFGFRANKRGGQIVRLLFSICQFFRFVFENGLDAHFERLVTECSRNGELSHDTLV